MLAVERVAKRAPQEGDVLIRNHAAVVTAAICSARAGRGFATRLYFGITRPK